jgi:hypothetical protein
MSRFTNRNQNRLKLTTVRIEPTKSASNRDKWDLLFDPKPLRQSENE